MAGVINMRKNSIMIRLVRLGCTNRPFYHIVAIPKKAPFQAKPLEQLGTFDPMANIFNEQLVAINFERLRYWLGVGNATASLPTQKLLGVCGFYPIHPMTYIQAQRKIAGKQIHGVAEPADDNTVTS